MAMPAARTDWRNPERAARVRARGMVSPFVLGLPPFFVEAIGD